MTSTSTFRLYGFNSESGLGTAGLQGPITITGTYESLGGTPTKLVVTSINSGSSPSVNTPFAVVVQSQDNSGIAQTVSANTDITFFVTQQKQKLRFQLLNGSFFPEHFPCFKIKKYEQLNQQY